MGYQGLCGRSGNSTMQNTTSRPLREIFLVKRGFDVQTVLPVTYILLCTGVEIAAPLLVDI
jgi:hypothetical protein